MAASVVEVGGVRVTCGQALDAVRVLAGNQASVIRSVLAAAGNPLAACDYRAVYKPRVAEAARHFAQQGFAGGIGPRGRHLAKEAFSREVTAIVTRAACNAAQAAFSAFAADERYAAAMAADAAAYRSRQHDSQIRSRAKQLITAAVQRCARSGTGTCALEGACGTGACPFADPALRAVHAPATPGRIARSPRHVRYGQGFSETAAAAALLAAIPWRPSVIIRDSDYAHASDLAA